MFGGTPKCLYIRKKTWFSLMQVLIVCWIMTTVDVGSKICKSSFFQFIIFGIHK